MEQIYITVDGRESGKRWVDDGYIAERIGDLLESILEDCTLDEMERIRLFLINDLGKSCPQFPINE